jgi:hypothetical protein
MTNYQTTTPEQRPSNARATPEQSPTPLLYHKRWPDFQAQFFCPRKSQKSIHAPPAKSLPTDRFAAG